MSSSSPSHNDFEAIKGYIKDSPLEAIYLKQFGLDSLDELNPNHFADLASVKAKVVTAPTISAQAIPTPAISLKTVDARPTQNPSSASAILEPFLRTRVNYLARRKVSTYYPSCLMMDYIIHIMNDYLVDNHYFKRDAPHYHPYILRLYYGVVFWIQCVRAGLEARKLTAEQHQFLLRFLDCHSLESLTIAAPLLPLFKTLCSSEPENKSYGLVFPTIPSSAGPPRRDAFMREAVPNFFLPNIPGIFALLENLNSLINGEPAVYPAKGRHIPVPEAGNVATIFGHYSFPPLNERTNFERYALCSPGLQYLCEADKKMNESFAERYDYYDFPTTLANDDLRPLDAFLHMRDSMAWFNQVKAVAAVAAKYFVGSGSLADCAPFGIMSNQYATNLQSVATPELPRHSADKRALFPFSFRLSTTVTNPAPLTEAMAAMAQTHISMPPNHPYLGTFGTPVGTGPFWAIRPIERSEVDETTYLSLPASVKDLLRSDPPK